METNLIPRRDTSSSENFGGGIPFPNFGKSAPDRVLVFKYGLNPTAKEDVLLTKENAQTIIENFESQRNLIAWDIDHAGTRNLPPEQTRAYGFSSIYQDDLGIWLHTKWTPDGKKLIESGGFIYFSFEVFGPVIDGIRYPQRLAKMSLTNQPLTKAMKPLLASEKGNSMDETTEIPSENQMSRIRAVKQMQQSASQLMASAQACMSFVGNPSYADPGLKPIAEGLMQQLPEVLEKIAEMLEGMDPEGQLLESGAYSEKAVTPDKVLSSAPIQNTTTSVDPAIQTLVDVCKKVSGETDIESVTGAILALSQNQKVFERKAEVAEKGKIAILVESGIREGKIPAHEKEQYMSYSEKVLTSHLNHTVGYYSEMVQDSEPRKEHIASRGQDPKVLKQIDEDVEKIMKALKG